MNEERMFILKMVEEGKITADEAAALLEALEDGRTVVKEPGPEKGAAGGAGTERKDAGPGASAKGKKVAQDLAAQISEVIQQALRSVPSITVEVRDGLKEVSEDLRQSLRDVKDEMKKKRLVDMSGLLDLVSHIRDVGFGQAHEFEERHTGVFAEDAGLPVVLLTSKNGSITVKGWDRPSYEVHVRKRIYGRDEDSARKAAETAVRVEATDRRIEVDGRNANWIAVSVEAYLPKERLIDLEAITRNGSISLQEIRVREGRATTTNGSVSLRTVRAERLTVSTVNGKVEAEAVRAQESDARTVNGNVYWNGSARRAALKTTNGNVRFGPLASDEEGTAAYEVETVNGNVKVRLPEAPVPVRLDARARSVYFDEAECGLKADGEPVRDGLRRHVTAESPGYQSAARRIHLEARTINGGVRIERENARSTNRDKAIDADEQPDNGRERGDEGERGAPADPQDA